MYQCIQRCLSKTCFHVSIGVEARATGRIGDTRLTDFVASDDQEIKEMVMDLTEGMGFEPLDCGSPRAARYLDPMSMLMMDLAFSLKMGNHIGYKLIKG